MTTVLSLFSYHPIHEHTPLNVHHPHHQHFLHWRGNKGEPRPRKRTHYKTTAQWTLCTNPYHVQKKINKRPMFHIAHLRRFLNFVNVFLLFCNYLPLEKGMALHLNELEFLHSRMFCAKFGWNWPSGSGEEIFYKFH